MIIAIKTWIFRFIDWYIYTYHSDSYVRKDKLPEIIKQVQESERSRVNKSRDIKEEEIISQLNEDHLIELEMKQAEIRSLENQIKEYARQRKELESLRYTVIRRSKENLRIAVDLKQASQQAVNSMILLNTAIGNIESKAEVLDNIITDSDSDERSKLSMAPKQIDLSIVTS